MNDATGIEFSGPPVRKPKDIGNPGKPVNERGVQDAQDRLGDDLLYGGQDVKPVAGVKMDHISLTTIGFMRKAGSRLLKGQRPKEPEEVLREIGIFLLAHDSGKPIRERIVIFKKSEEEIRDEADAFMHSVPIMDLGSLLNEVASRLAEETRNLPVPVKKSGEEENESEGTEGN